ncbi:MAG: acyl-CoA dehydrogenase family protein [Candidatus Hydrogenedentota bacterium]
MAIDTERDIYQTHEVINQPTALNRYNLFESDAALKEGVIQGRAEWAHERLAAFGEKVGTPEYFEKGEIANRVLPELETHDRFGKRVDQVKYHPAYHEMFATGVAAEMHALPWNTPKPGAHVARAATHYMLSQIESGVGCPITMTFAVVPALRLQPEVAAVWEPRVTSTKYDPRFIPAEQKTGCTMGMALTEKQGGSDVRANSTRAVPIGAEGPGQEYLLTGHKWFCSAPMSDAFLMTAYTDNGLSCFLVPRFLPDGTKNRFFILRLKDKVGNKANASSEIELLDTWGIMVGDEGHGVRNIVQMIHHTRLDCSIGTAAIMRQALVQALHYTSGREAFGATLTDQPLMQNVLADLAIEQEAATALMMRLAQCYDDQMENPGSAYLVRLATPVAKYWITKRAPDLIYECMECLGGMGYVEETPLPRLFREGPVNSIWEGSGNVISLDMLRAMDRDPETIPALLAEVEKARGADKRLDAYIDSVKAEFVNLDALQMRARRIIERLALVLQGALLVQRAPDFVADAFCASRLGGDKGHAYGTLPPGVDAKRIVERAKVTV